MSESRRRQLLGFTKTARVFQCRDCAESGHTEFSGNEAAMMFVEKGHHSATCKLCDNTFDVVYKQCRECKECNVFLNRGGPDDVCCYCGTLRDEQPDE